MVDARSFPACEAERAERLRQKHQEEEAKRAERLRQELQKEEAERQEALAILDEMAKANSKKGS